MDFPTTLLVNARRLRWIQVTGAGVDAFLAEGTLLDGVILTRSEGSFGEQIAEYVLAHLLAIAQRMRDVHRLQAACRWKPLTVDRLRGRVIGIAGTDSIGGAVARAASGLGIRTMGLNRSGSPRGGFVRCYRAEQLNRFLEQLDVLVLGLPLIASTRGLMGRDELASMKRSAVLGVFAEEPLPAENPLWTLDRVVVTSHHAGLNLPDEMLDGFLGNLERFRLGRPLHGVVDPVRGY